MKSLSAFLIIGFVIISFIFWGIFSNIRFDSNHEQTVKRLSGSWKFQLGDNPEYANPEWNDKEWEKINVPGQWEKQGYREYDGYAWYRTTFKLKSRDLEKSLILNLGYIDDVDAVYLNGVLIGQTGSFPPFYESAHDQNRNYKLPAKFLKEKGNVIAVRVFDQYEKGGIVSGTIEIFKSDYFEPQVPLSNRWKFSTGDNMQWSRKDYDDSGWDLIKVPAKWEDEGYEDYDGFAWYRTRFILNKASLNEQYVLMLGKIDDINEVYLNGRLIGNHGDFTKIGEENYKPSTYYNVRRGYYIPKGYLTDGENVIAVRVYDTQIDGGIYDGPIGLVTQEAYTKKWNKKKDTGFF